jgi:hypothetical protein
MPKTKCYLLLAILFFSCYKAPDIQEPDLPKNYQEMFERLKIQPNVSYRYIESINNKETGNEGLIRFSLKDSSMEETFNNVVTKDYFRLDSFQHYTSKFESFGLNKYNRVQSTFINKAQQKISHVNGVTMVSFNSIENGSYYYYQYLIVK